MSKITDMPLQVPTKRSSTSTFRLERPSGTSGIRETKDDERLRMALRRAVHKDAAPQHLIDSIRRAIRKG